MYFECDFLVFGYSGLLKILIIFKEGFLLIRLDLIYLDWWGFFGVLCLGVGNWICIGF